MPLTANKLFSTHTHTQTWILDKFTNDDLRIGLEINLTMMSSFVHVDAGSGAGKRNKKKKQKRCEEKALPEDAANVCSFDEDQVGGQESLDVTVHNQSKKNNNKKHAANPGDPMMHSCLIQCILLSQIQLSSRWARWRWWASRTPPRDKIRPHRCPLSMKQL